ncbi:MAG: VOC family protein [Candidatus Sericytochromatia bacterium]|nr:VOC family protein [Candidatus Sericytochromatia bacterium]
MKSHLSLYVSDLLTSTDFYTRFLGVAPVKTKPDYAKFELADPAQEQVNAVCCPQ